nr:flavin reductase [uncultured Acidocella sp.]
MTIDTALFRDAMARLGAAVNIITTRAPEGDMGFTASAVCSVTDTPATLLVCMNKNSRLSGAFQQGGPLCVNVLNAYGEPLSRLFSGQQGLSMAERFAQAGWGRLETGAPVLEAATAAFDGVISSVVEIGTHRVLFCDVRAVKLCPQATGLVYHQRRYHRLETALQEAG